MANYKTRRIYWTQTSTTAGWWYCPQHHKHGTAYSTLDTHLTNDHGSTEQ